MTANVRRRMRSACCCPFVALPSCQLLPVVATLRGACERHPRRPPSPAPPTPSSTGLLAPACACCEQRQTRVLWASSGCNGCGSWFPGGVPSCRLLRAVQQLQFCAPPMRCRHRAAPKHSGGGRCTLASPVVVRVCGCVCFCVCVRRRRRRRVTRRPASLEDLYEHNSSRWLALSRSLTAAVAGAWASVAAVPGRQRHSTQSVVRARPQARLVGSCAVARSSGCCLRSALQPHSAHWQAATKLFT